MKSKLSPAFALVLAVAAAVVVAAPAGAQILFDAQLSGANEVPSTPSTASGSCTGVLTGFGGPAADPEFHLSCEHNVLDATLAHIHIGFAGQVGPPVVTLDVNDIDAVWDLSVDEAIRLLAGGYYVNVHSPTFPAGEIRGQLRPRQTNQLDVEVLRFDLSGDQMVPEVATDSTGHCVAFFELDGLPEQGTVDLYCTHDVVGATEIVVVDADSGEEGEVIANLGDATSPIVIEDLTLNSALTQALRSGELALVIRSTTNPDGEIRGQLTGCFESETVLCLANDRFAVTVDWRTEQGGGGAGVGHAVSETDNTGMFWFFEPSNLELMIKVLDACPVNGHFWVFFAGLTNVGYDVRVTDTVTGETNVYSNEDETTALPVLDTAAFDTCDAP